MSVFASSSAAFSPVISQSVNEVDRQAFVGQRIYPVVNVNTSKGNYVKIEANQFDNDFAKPRKPGSNFASDSQEYTSAAYDCMEYGLEVSIDDLELSIAETDALLDVAAVTANQIADDLAIGHEIRVANSLNGASFNSTAATAAMSVVATATPIADINNAVLRLNANGMFRNINLVMEASLYAEMLQTDDMRQLINGSGTLAFSQDQVAKVLGVDGIVICNTRYNSAKKGQARSSSKIWSDSAYYVMQIAQGAFANGGVGRTLAYNGGTGSGLFTAETFRTEQPPASVVRVRQNVDEVILNVNAGEKITGA